MSKENQALLIIDMQRAFVEKDQPLCVKGAEQTVPYIIHVVSEARKQGMKVIWIRRNYKADGSDMEAFRRKKLQERRLLDVMAEGSYGALPVQGLEEESGDLVIIKKRFSGFFHTNLKEYLDENHIDTIIIAGTQTPNCVRATAVDAIENDYHTIVLSDCTSSTKETVQQSNLEDMRHMGIDVLTSKEYFGWAE